MCKKIFLYCSVPGAFADNSSFQTKHFGQCWRLQYLLIFAVNNEWMDVMPAGQKGEWTFKIIRLKIHKAKCGLKGSCPMQETEKNPKFISTATMKMRDSLRKSRHYHCFLVEPFGVTCILIWGFLKGIVGHRRTFFACVILLSILWRTDYLN